MIFGQNEYRLNFYIHCCDTSANLQISQKNQKKLSIFSIRAEYMAKLFDILLKKRPPKDPHILKYF